MAKTEKTKHSGGAKPHKAKAAKVSSVPASAISTAAPAANQIDIATADTTPAKSRKFKRPQWLHIPAKFKRARRPRSIFNPHRAFRMTPVRRPESALRSMQAGWRLTRETFIFCKLHGKKLGSLALLYAVVAYVVAGGLSQLDYLALRESVEDTVGGKATTLPGIATLFTGSVAAVGKTSGELQRFLAGFVLILFVLSVIWSVRMLMAGKKFVLRDALYSSAAPLVPAMLIVFVITLQLLPSVLGIFAYIAAVGGDFWEGNVEGLMFGAAGLLLSTLSLYWITSSLIALIIVTLPGMYPVRALREARDLVAGRRLRILLRVLVLALIISLAWLVVLAPVILLDSWLQVSYLPLVPLFIQLLGGLTLVFSSTYVYRLYRTLL